MGDMSKICTKCGRHKYLTDYHRSNRYLDGRVQRCKVCVSEYSKKLYQANPLKFKKYNEQNTELRKAYHEKYRLENKQNARAYKKARLRDPVYRLRKNLQKRVYNALKSSRSAKQISATKVVGCSIPVLKRYLEKHFQPGMTWENYGMYGWHVDHIIPCSLFDLSDPVQQQQCFHYSNLQPLWAEDNLKKQAKLIF